MHSFQTISAYFCTYHNVTADCFMRDKCEEVDELLQRHGLELFDAKPDWALHLERDWTRRVLAWHGQDPGDHQVAMQLAERRQGSPLPTTPTPLPAPRPSERFHVSGWRATLGRYAAAALGQGARGSLIPLKGGPRLESNIWPPAIERNREQDARATDGLLASFTEDPSGEEARRFALVLRKTGARVCWVDAPAKANLQPLTSLRSEGWKFGGKVAELDVDFGELGEPANSGRKVIAACLDGLEPWALEDLESLRATLRESSWLEKAKVIPDGGWIASDRELFTGKILPPPSGHPSSGHIKPVGRLKDGPAGQYYFDPSKQLPTLRKASWQAGDDALLLTPERTVRRIQPIEVWRLKEGSTPAWRAALAEGHPRRARNLGCPDPLPWGRRDRRGLVTWCVATHRSPPQTDEGERRAGVSGVCPLPDEEEAWAAVKGWLAARAVADGIRRVGGPKKRKGVPPDNANARQLTHILVALLRHRLTELQADSGGWALLPRVVATVGGRRLTATPPTLDEIKAAIEASEGRLALQMIGEEDEYRIRPNLGHTGDTELASLGQALGCIEPWMLHATTLALLPCIWEQGWLPH